MPAKSHTFQYEPVGKSKSWTWLFAGTLLTILVITFLVATGSQLWTQPQPQSFPLDTASLQEPPLRINPLADLQTLRAEEMEILSSYGWVDKDAGIVRIPIEQAMDLLLEQGLPVRNTSSQ